MTSPEGGPDRRPSCESRASLLDLVEEAPGQSLLDAARTLDLHVSTVSYHARRLEEQGRARLIRDGRCLRMFPKGNGLAPREAAFIAALKSPRAREVVELLADRPGLTKADAARALDLSVKGLSWHVDRLDDLGVVDIGGDSRGYALRLAEGYEGMVARLERYARLAHNGDVHGGAGGDGGDAAGGGPEDGEGDDGTPLAGGPARTADEAGDDGDGDDGDRQGPVGFPL